MHYFIKLLLTGAILALFHSHTNAQITIGSTNKPNQGSLLDLKEEEVNNGSANSRKGLAMPRVKILSRTLPEEGASLSTTIDKATGNWDSKTHIGLVVYHSDNNSLDGIGLYVWTGTEWSKLGEKIRNKPEDD